MNIIEDSYPYVMTLVFGLTLLSLLRWSDLLPQEGNSACMQEPEDYVSGYTMSVLVSVFVAITWPILLVLAIVLCAAWLLHWCVRKR